LLKSVKSLKTLILGLGNSILKDDGIGPRLIQELQDSISDPDTTLQETNLSGLSLLEIISGFDYVVILDAVQSGGKPGKIYWLTPQDIGGQGDYSYLHHNMGLLKMLELGKSLTLPMPEEMSILAIEAEDVTTFGESLTPEVEKAIPSAVELVLSEISKRQKRIKTAE
jgi:hydrogenase maturation protease